MFGAKIVCLNSRKITDAFTGELISSTTPKCRIRKLLILPLPACGLEYTILYSILVSFMLSQSLYSQLPLHNASEFIRLTSYIERVAEYHAYTHSVLLSNTSIYFLKI